MAASLPPFEQMRNASCIGWRCRRGWVGSKSKFYPRRPCNYNTPHHDLPRFFMIVSLPRGRIKSKTLPQWETSRVPATAERNCKEAAFGERSEPVRAKHASRKSVQTQPEASMTLRHIAEEFISRCCSSISLCYLTQCEPTNCRRLSSSRAPDPAAHTNVFFSAVT